MTQGVEPTPTPSGESFEEWLARNYPNQFPGQLRAAYEAGYRSGLQAGIDRYSEADLRKLAESILADDPPRLADYGPEAENAWLNDHD